MKNAQEICLDPGSEVDPNAEPTPEPTPDPSSDPTADPSADTASAPSTDPSAEPTVAPDLSECSEVQMVVPTTSEIVQRRDYVLELMKTRSTLSGDLHTAAQYEAAKAEPVVLSPQVSATWKAPHFVWQVRDELARILCPDDPGKCSAVDTGGYKVTTTLDWTMQQTTEKYVYAAARIPQSKDPRAALAERKIPRSEWGWIQGLRGRNIHNAAAGVIDYRTGEVLAYVGSASYTSKGTKKFQPQFDVLSQGWRQPGSSIKPIDYLIGIEDETLTASTMFMDVSTNFGRNFIPIQADKLERGPVRLRSALQFSLNVPAIKATIISGLDHVFDRTKDFGLVYPSSATPVLSEGIGTLEVHPMDLLGAYGTIANGGVKMPRQTVAKITDSDGKQVWPLPPIHPRATRSSAGRPPTS
ncbi:MAG: penicillin-binding transpeptidase domain-containing protein [Candidatus Limnocylindrales bacterium]